MGANQSHASFPSGSGSRSYSHTYPPGTAHSTASSGSAGSADTYHSSNSSNSSGSTSSTNSARSYRHHAVRHREAPVAAPGSRREFLLQQQQLVQEEYFDTKTAYDNVYGSTDADLACEDYVTYSMAEVPGYFYNNGTSVQVHAGHGTRGLSLSRRHAQRSAAAPQARSGSRRAAMIEGERAQRSDAAAGINGFSRRAGHSHSSSSNKNENYRSMEVPVAASAEAAAARYMIRPRPAGYTAKSRFVENF